MDDTTIAFNDKCPFNIHWAPPVPDSEDANINKTKSCVLQDKLTGKTDMQITHYCRM